MEKAYIYLRKSRADIEKEKEGEFETLQRHRSFLLRIAAERKLEVVKILEEIVSGENIAQRPKMLELLQDASDRLFSAVLCMDIDRLGRGNMQDQGLILDTMKNSDIKIVTPRKTYNLLDEFDEEYSEFEAFMARKELKLIKRRLLRGRERSVEDGNYLGSVPPYGYMFEYGAAGKKLIPHPEQSAVVKLIFDYYVNENLGGQKIAVKLNELGFTTYTGAKWDGRKVASVLKNNIYAGKISWHKRRRIEPFARNSHKKGSRNNPKSEWLIVDGKHEAIVSEEDFEAAQTILEKKSCVPHKQEIANPLAGIIFCKTCGSSMVLRKNGRGGKYIVCYKSCGNKGSKFEYIESKIVNFLKNYFFENNSKINMAPYQKSDRGVAIYNNILKNIEALKKQKSQLYDLLEKGIYDSATFTERFTLLTDKIQKCSLEAEYLENNLNNEKPRRKISFSLEAEDSILNCYLLCAAKEKNFFLKSVIEKIEYYKNRNSLRDNFDITIKTWR